MSTRSTKMTGQEAVSQNETVRPRSEAGHDHDDACRCKETSAMTPRQLLELMMRDLAFWKRPKKG